MYIKIIFKRQIKSDFFSVGGGGGVDVFYQKLSKVQFAQNHDFAISQIFPYSKTTSNIKMVI